MADNLDYLRELVQEHTPPDQLIPELATGPRAFLMQDTTPDPYAAVGGTDAMMNLLMSAGAAKLSQDARLDSKATALAALGQQGLSVEQRRQLLEQASSPGTVAAAAEGNVASDMVDPVTGKIIAGGTFSKTGKGFSASSSSDDFAVKHLISLIRDPGERAKQLEALNRGQREAGLQAEELSLKKRELDSLDADRRGQTDKNAALEEEQRQKTLKEHLDLLAKLRPQLPTPDDKLANLQEMLGLMGAKPLDYSSKPETQVPAQAYDPANMFLSLIARVMRGQSVKGALSGQSDSGDFYNPELYKLLSDNNMAGGRVVNSKQEFQDLMKRVLAQAKGGK